MKKIALMSLLVLTVMVGYGQEEESLTKRKTRFGITAGYDQNFFKLQFDERNSVINHDHSILFGGFFVETPLNKRLSLQTELLYSRITSEDLNMIELPVLLKYRIGKRWSITGGPQLNYIFHDGGDRTFARNINEKLTVGFSIGIEYDITRNLSAFFRYTHRFTKCIHPDLGNINGFRLGLAYRF